MTDHSILDGLLKTYERAANPNEAAETRLTFLRLLAADPELLRQDRSLRFLAEHVQPEELAGLEWNNPEQAITFAETLYDFRSDDSTLVERTRRHIVSLLRQALRHYEEQGERESVFQLVRLAPTHLLMLDAELRRWRHRAHSYEMQRIRRNRRILFAYLVVQAVLVVAVFPWLFINAENGRIQRQVEEVADVELGDEGYQLVTYPEGLYWAIITASSIDYGDITPRTTTGRIIAGVLGTMGVITVGIVAGLILDWMSPRRID